MNISLDSGRDIGKVYQEFLRTYRFTPKRDRQVMGLDLGRVQDYTAISILEDGTLRTGEVDRVTLQEITGKYLAVRYLERLKLGTPYPDVVERVRAILSYMDRQERPDTLVVDATGVGAPVVDMLRRASLDMNIIPVLITGGVKASSSGGDYLVPKRDLITNLQLLMQTGTLRLAGGMEELETLKGEMGRMEVKISASGTEQFACWREREHDDLVLSVALGAWWLTTHYR